jgi:hypothetical protein
MALITVRPTQLDKDIARGVARHADVPIERAAEVLTWGADEHLLIAAAMVGWLVTRKSEEPLRRLSTHFLLCSLSSAVLPHILKALIDQERPDRLTVSGRTVIRAIGYDQTEIEDRPETACVRRAYERVKMLHGAEQRIDAGVVRNVVAEICHRRWKDRRQPDRVDAERQQVG